MPLKKPDLNLKEHKEIKQANRLQPNGNKKRFIVIKKKKKIYNKALHLQRMKLSTQSLVHLFLLCILSTENLSVDNIGDMSNFARQYSNLECGHTSQLKTGKSGILRGHENISENDMPH